MKRKLPRYTHGYVDQHGKPRFYLRRPGHKKIPLPGLPWSPEFMEARDAAHADSGTSLFSRPRAEDVTVFTRDLALLLKAGARIDDALDLLAVDIDIGRLRAVVATSSVVVGLSTASGLPAATRSARSRE